MARTIHLLRVTVTAFFFCCLSGVLLFSQTSSERTLKLPGEHARKTQSLNNNQLSTTIVSFDNSLLNAADFIISVQSTSNYGWDWQIFPPFVHAVTTSNNLYGVTGLGLYYAYLNSNNVIYKNALQNACDQMVANPLVKDAGAIKLLLLFQNLPGVTPSIYKNAAKAKYDARIAEHGPSATSFAQWLVNNRGVTQGYKNGIIPWDISAFAVTAKMLYTEFGGTYNQDAVDIAEVLYQDSYNNSPGYFIPVGPQNQGWDPTYANTNFWWYTLGISGLIDAFVSSNTHADKLPGLITILNDCKYTTGSIRGAYSGSYGAHIEPTFNDDDWQTTAYVVMSLANYNKAVYQGEINSACYYLSTTQDPATFAWIYSDNSTYPEVDGECANALYYGTKALTEYVNQTFTALSCGGHFWGYDAFDNIQTAVDAAGNSAVINAAAGTYNEAVNLNKVLTLNGAGSGLAGTIITNPSGTALTLSAGTDAAHRVIANNLRLTGSTTGLVVNSYNTIDNVFSLANTSYGINLSNLSDLVISNSKFDNNNVGLKIASTVSADHVTITNSSFDGNVTGWYGDANSVTEPTFNYVNVSSTTFNNNQNKGIYLERLSNAVFNNITVDNSGTGGAVNHRAGIDLNLKWRMDYANITFQNSTISNSGLGDDNGAGMIIKARSDGATYGANPAALINVVLSNLSVTGNGNGLYSSGIRIGEANNSLTGTNVSPTNVNISNSRFVGNAPFALSNVLNSILVTAENNWWDAIDESIIQTRINNYAHVDYDPWQGKGYPKAVISWPVNNATVYTNKPTLLWYILGTPPVPTSYTVLIRKDGHAYGEAFPNGLSINAGTNTSATVPNGSELAPGQKYFYTVRANYTGGVIYTLAPEESFTVDNSQGGAPIPVPTYPVSATVYSASPTLFWYLSAPAYGTITYHVIITDTADHSVVTGNHIVSSSTSLPLAVVLTGGHTYNWRVRTINGALYSEYSANAVFTVDGGASGNPVKPILSYPVNGTTVYTTTPTLYWYLSTYSTGLSYEVELRPSDVPLTGVATNTGLSSLSFVTGVLTAPSYHWAVRSYIGAVYSDWSDVGTFNVYNSSGGTPVTPIPIYPVNGGTVYTVAPTVYWYLASYMTGLTYKVHYGTVAGGPYPNVTGVTSNSYSTLGGLLAGTHYYYKVEAISGVLSTFSAEASFIVAGGNGTPSTPNASWPVGGTTIYSSNQTLYWWMNTTVGVVSYKIKVSVNPDMSAAVEYLSASTLYALTGLVPGETYYWQVQSYDGTNYSPFNAIESFSVYGGDFAVRPLVGGPTGNIILGTLSPTLSWYLPVNSSEQTYQVEYSKNADFSNSVTIDNVTSLSANVQNLSNGAKYFWRVRSLKNGNYSNYSFKGEFISWNGVTNVNEEGIIPDKFSVAQNYPNPFNPSTTIKYGLPKDAFVSIKIYNMLGQEVKSLVNGTKNAGTYSIIWNGDNNFGQKVTSGTYVYRVSAGENVQSMKMIYLK